jgi:prepilin-type N-terminal cleavage/methylation domain-containing protein
MNTNGRPKRSVERGFSVLELLVVIAIIAIMIGVAIFSLPTAQRALAPDNASDQMVDVLRFSLQRALAERQVMRVEVTAGTGTTPGKIEIYDEGRIAPGDEALIRTESLVPNAEVTLNTSPTAFVRPPSPHNFDAAPFVSNKLKVFFNPDGTVTNAADIPQSFSLVLFTPMGGGSPDPGSIRAITLFGPTASVNEWRWDAGANQFVEN